MFCHFKLIDLTLWKVGPKTSQAVMFSETEEEGAKTIWLPSSQIEIEPPTVERGKVEVTLPE